MGEGGGSGIATAPEMLRLTSAISTTKTSVIPVCTLTRFMSANVFQVDHVPTIVLDTERLYR